MEQKFFESKRQKRLLTRTVRKLIRRWACIYIILLYKFWEFHVVSVCFSGLQTSMSSQRLKNEEERNSSVAILLGSDYSHSNAAIDMLSQIHQHFISELHLPTGSEPCLVSFLSTSLLSCHLWTALVRKAQLQGAKRATKLSPGRQSKTSHQRFSSSQ